MTEAQEVRARAKALRERREELEKALAGAAGPGARPPAAGAGPGEGGAGRLYPAAEGADAQPQGALPHHLGGGGRLEVGRPSVPDLGRAGEL
ncbi:hypothetical protein [Flavonifractor plautii]|uniref:hypothetical protein n=1 Tax=Flavonifractor plautii TaxID=292800 RepID=UPI0018E3276C|nr:hypothetical protein [Flavonifractor plautii]